MKSIPTTQYRFGPLTTQLQSESLFPPVCTCPFLLLFFLKEMGGDQKYTSVQIYEAQQTSPLVTNLFICVSFLFVYV